MPIDGSTTHGLEKRLACGVGEAIGIVRSELRQGTVKFCEVNPMDIEEELRPCQQDALW